MTKREKVSRKGSSGSAGGRPLRRFVRKVFSSWIGQQNCDCQDDIEALYAKLQEIEDSIEVIARGISRQTKEDRR